MWLISGRAEAQTGGTVNFGNSAATQTINSQTGNPASAADGIRAALYWAPTNSSSFVQIGAAVNVGVPLAGLFAGGTRSAGGTTPGGAPGQFLVKAWNGGYATYEQAAQHSGALLGQSSVMTAPTGNPGASPPTPPASLAANGLTSFSLFKTPAISIPPTNKNVSAGSTITFAMAATGTGPLSYQWQANGTNLADGTRISGSRSNVLSLLNVLVSDAGAYQVQVTNSYGSVTSVVATLTVGLPPQVTTQPTNRLAAVGATALFAVGATGTAPLGYQWRFNGTNLVDGSRLSGSLTASLTLSNALLTDTGNYQVVVTNGYGSITSAVATLTVGLPPQVTTQPTNVTTAVGTTIAFSAAATGTAPSGYQWQSNGSNLTDGLRIVGSLSPTLTISNTLLTDTGNYQVLVTNAYGSATSVVATLSVGLPPQVTTQPTNQLAAVGATALFAVGATGTAPLGYQWRFNGTNLVDGSRLSGSLTPSLTLSNALLTDTGNYQVVVTNGYGSITSAVATLTVGLPPQVTTQPTNVMAAVGTTIAFSAAATGTIPLGYQWQSNGSNLTDGLRITGSLTPTLTISNALLTDTGNYQVLVTNAYGLATSVVATLSVGLPPQVTTQPTNRLAAVGATALFAVATTGTAPLAYQWRFNGTNLADGSRISGSLTASLTLSNALLTDTGNYQVVVTNGYGSITSAVATLTVGLPPQVITQPSNVVTAVGTTISFSATATGTVPLGYQWQINGSNLSDGLRIAGSLTTTLTISNTLLTDTGNYQILVTNAYGSATSSAATLTVGLPPQIGTQPTNRLAIVGRSAAFSVGASGTAPLAYQWQFYSTNLLSGTRITGAMTLTLGISNVALADTGGYDVVITNTFGALTSVVATLSAAGAPVIQSVGFSNGALNLTWSAVAGFTYQAQYTNTLFLGKWGNVGGPVTATNSSASASDPAPTDPQRFYRILLISPP